MLTSRFMFNLREAYLSGNTGGTSSSLAQNMSSVNFTANVVGNLGASLTFGDPDDDSRLNNGDNEKNKPSPVTCDDPFTFGLISDGAVQAM